MAIKNVITILLGAWLICGIFIDGFAHKSGIVETFFTPWHAVLYSGYLATAAWMVFITYQNSKKTGKPFADSIPTGYGLGIIGVVLFLFGGVSDMIWHMIFGVEEDLAALLSPSHLLLLVGVLLIITSPLRMGWRELGHSPGWKELFPAILSITFTISLAGFFLMYAWTFNNGWVAAMNTLIRYNGSHMYDEIIKLGVINTIITTTLMMAPVYMLTRRWRLPFGAISLMFTVETALMSALEGFGNYQVIVLALFAGLIADLWLKRPLCHLRIFSVVLPAVVWSVFYAGVALLEGMGWEPEVWGGAIVLSSLWSLGLNLLVFPPKQSIREET